MVFRVIWAPRAIKEIHQIAAYLAEHSARAAERFLGDLQRARRQLSEFPASGTADLIPETRRLILGDYIVSYRLRDEVVETHAVRHGRRRDARP
jgi:plasmid stabilization system protein ParE